MPCRTKEKIHRPVLRSMDFCLSIQNGLLLCGASEAAVALFGGIIILCDSKGQEDALHEPFPRGKLQGLAFVGIVGDFREDVSFVVGIVIVAVDNTNCIV